MDSLGGTPDLVNLAIAISRRCDLDCGSYLRVEKTSPQTHIDMKALHLFLAGVDFSHVHAVGFSGGEPSLVLPEIREVCSWLSCDTQRFVITNGAWTDSAEATASFMQVAEECRLRVLVSSGTKQRLAQRDEVLLRLMADDRVTLRVAQKRNRNGGHSTRNPIHCARKCFGEAGPLRLTVQPEGTIITHNCDGKYPVVGNLTDGFAAAERSARQAVSCIGGKG